MARLANIPPRRFRAVAFLLSPSSDPPFFLVSFFFCLVHQNSIFPMSRFFPYIMPVYLARARARPCRVTGGILIRRKSVAVLPFVNRSPDSVDTEYDFAPSEMSPFISKPIFLVALRARARAFYGGLTGIKTRDISKDARRALNRGR